MNVTATSLTKPLVGKIFIAFSIMIVLIATISISALFSLSQTSNAHNYAIKLERQAQHLRDLQDGVLAYQSIIGSSEFNITSLETIRQISNAFDSHLYNLQSLGFDVFPLTAAHNELASQLSQAARALNNNNPVLVKETLKNTQQPISQLLKLTNTTLHQREQAVMSATDEVENVQQNGVGLVVFITLVALLLSVAAFFFVGQKVVRPLGGLNQHLNQLLWTQTEHLTDRLNHLQADIDHNNEMLTAVRHDLKAPLSSIKGLAELSVIMQPNLDNETRNNLAEIVKVSDKGVDMVSTLLARQESQLDLQIVNLGELVDKLLSLVDLRLYDVQRKVEVNQAVFDPALMEHALLNLISNARKFCQSGIAVGTRKVRKAGTLDEYEIELFVWNDGALINAADRLEIFKPGKQTDEGKKAGGHGLGLAIVKSVAERHHGRVSVDSHEKVGTTFRIFLPEIVLESNLTTNPPVAKPTEAVLTNN